MKKIALVLALTLSFGLVAQGATYYWDDGTVTVNGASGGGSGAWTVGASGWEDGTSAQNWADGNDADLGGTAGTLTLGSDISVGAVTLRVNGYMINSAGNTMNINGAMSGAYTFTYGGSGTFNLAGNNNNTAAITINAATVHVNSGATLQRGTVGSWANQTVTVTNGGTLESYDFNNVGGLWGYTSDAAGNLVFGTGGGTYKYLGNNTVTAPNKGITVNSGATGHFYVPAGNSATWSGKYSGRNFVTNGTLDFNGGGNFTTEWYISGSGNVTKNDGGTLTLQSVNSFTGALTVNAGTLVASAATSGNPSATGNGSATNVITVNDGATLQYTVNRGAGYHSANAVINGGTITFDGGDMNFASGKEIKFDTALGTINGTGMLRRRDTSNKVTVTDAASGSTISVATLNLLDNNPAFDVADGAAASDLTISSQITGGAGLVKSGAGTLTLSNNANTYTGATTVNAGTLNVTGTLASKVTANTGTTVTGNGGKFNGGLIMSSGSTHAPGASPGKEYVANTLTYNGATLEIDIWTNDDGDVATAGTGYDQIEMTGAAPQLTLSGAPQIVVDLDNTYNPAVWNSYQIITGIDTTTGVFNGTVTVQNASTDWTNSGNYFRIDYNADNIALTVIPEPATFGLVLAFGAAAVIRRRRIG